MTPETQAPQLQLAAPRRLITSGSVGLGQASDEEREEELEVQGHRGYWPTFTGFQLSLSLFPN